MMKPFQWLGIAVLAALASSASAAPQYINCAAAKALDERTICRNTRLVQLDAEMATLYDLIRGFVPMGTRGAIQDEQREWLVVRIACRASVPCLRTHYRDRIEELNQHFQRIRAQGPF